MEKLPLTSTHAGSHGRRTDGRCGEDTAYVFAECSTADRAHRNGLACRAGSYWTSHAKWGTPSEFEVTGDEGDLGLPVYFRR